jgi:hypothetical protein
VDWNPLSGEHFRVGLKGHCASFLGKGSRKIKTEKKKKENEKI